MMSLEICLCNQLKHRKQCENTAISSSVLGPASEVLSMTFRNDMTMIGRNGNRGEEVLQKNLDRDILAK